MIKVLIQDYVQLDEKGMDKWFKFACHRKITVGGNAASHG